MSTNKPTIIGLVVLEITPRSLKKKSNFNFLHQDSHHTGFKALTVDLCFCILDVSLGIGSDSVTNRDYT